MGPVKGKKPIPPANKHHSSSSAEHKKAIAQQYSEEWEYWKNVYDGKQVSGGEGGDAGDISYAHRRDIILGLVDDFAGTRHLKIIDVGCGAGVLVTRLAERGHSVAGIDISEKMVEEAQKAADMHSPGKAVCRVGDIESLPFEDGSFDIVIAAGVLSHQLDDRMSVRELKRIVRPDGIIIITLPNRLKLKYLLDPYYYYLVLDRTFRRIIFREKGNNKSSGFTRFMKTNSVAVRKYYYGQLNKLFRENGLGVRKTIGCGFGPLTFFGKNILIPERWVKFSRSVESWSARKMFGFLNIFATFWVIQLDRASVADGDIE